MKAARSSVDSHPENNSPFEGLYSETWNGKLADESYPITGMHTLYVGVIDGDNNRSELLSAI